MILLFHQFKFKKMIQFIGKGPNGISYWFETGGMQ